MTDPLTLSPEQQNCPLDCPFLSPRHFLPEILPFFCDKYDLFLGAVGNHYPARCAPCRGVVISTQQQGLALIDAYTVPLVSIPDMKEAFLGMSRAYQAMFVELVRRTGKQVSIPYGSQSSPGILAEKILEEWKEASELAGSPELKEFKDTIGKLADDMPTLLTRQTQNLLSNLFQVLDKSERQMLKGVLNNAKQAEAFLDQFNHMTKDMSLLKNFRAMLYEYDDNEKKRQQQELEQRMIKERMQFMQNTRGRDGR